MDNAGPTKTQIDDLPPSLTVPEAAAALRRSRAWAYAAIADGRLPARRTVAGLRILREDFLRLLQEAPLATPLPRDAA